MLKFWHICVAGELITVDIERSRPGIGVVTATWHIAAVNSRPPHLRFDSTSGTVLFHQVAYLTIIPVNYL